MQKSSENEKNLKKTIDLDNLLELLGNPTRRIILSKIAKIPHSTSELAHELGISRQAVHSQLEILKENALIEKRKPQRKRGGKYKIKNNISVTIDITPDYFNIDYRIAGREDIEKFSKFDTNCQEKYNRSKTPDQKMKFLGEQIRGIENRVQKLEQERNQLLLQKECFIKELKTLLDERYKEKKIKNIEQRQSKKKFITESLNLGREIFISIFSNAERYHRFKIDHLLDELFFNNMDSVKREQNKVFIQPLLKDLSGILDILREDEDFWFMDL